MDIKHLLQNPTHSQIVSALYILASATLFKRNKQEDLEVRSRAWLDLTWEKNVSPLPEEITQFRKSGWEGPEEMGAEAEHKNDPSIRGWRRKWKGAERFHVSLWQASAPSTFAKGSQ